MKTYVFILFATNLTLMIITANLIEDSDKNLIKSLKLIGFFPTPRIIGGTEAKLGQFPWHVILRRHELDKVWCGGSIISENWILTAAHCVEGFNIMLIVYGTIELNEINNIMKSNVFVIHPAYDAKNYKNDIALIKLPELLKFDNKVNKIALVPRLQAGNSFAGQITNVIGFGYTSDEIPDFPNKLLYTNMEVITNKECQIYYGDIIVSSTLCAKGERNANKNICGGDSGGAMVVEQDDGFIQIGISSFVTHQGCEEGVPSGFSRVGAFLDFISEQTGIITDL